MKQLVTFALAAAAALAACAPAGAMEATAAGVKLGVVNPDGGDASLAVGMHMEFTEPTSRWHLAPELLFWKDTDYVSDFAVNGNVFYEFGRAARTRPYLGMGLNINFLTIDVPGEDDNEVDLGLNLLGGVLLPISSGVRGFAEGRYAVTDLDHLMLLTGLTFFWD